MSERTGQTNDPAVAATPRPRPARDTESAYREHMAHVLYQLRLAFPRLGGDERLEIYDEIWTQLLERHRSGFWPDDLRGWLIGAVIKAARSEHRKRRGRRTDPSDPFEGEMTLVCDQDMEEAVLGSLDAESYTAIIASLSPTGRLVAKLRFDWGLTAREICEATGLDRRRCYKEIERATARLRTGGRRVRRGEHVRGYEKLLRRYLAGTATPTERAAAVRLVESSSQARMIAAQMFRDAREVGALLPAPAFGDQHARGTALELLSAVKEHLIEGLTGAKQHATAAYVRASEVPQQVGQHASALRPGGAALAISGCLAVGGGTAACLVEGVNPAARLYDTIDAGDGGEKPENAAQSPAKAEPTPTAAPSPLPATPAPAPVAKVEPNPAPTPARERTPPAPPPSQAAPSPAGPQREFEFERSRPTAPRTPAPAPTKGPGEFF